MQTTVPPPLKHAGAVVFPDEASPLLVQIIAMVALGWLYLAPVWVGIRARRHHGERAFAGYLLGVVVVAAFFTGQSGLMGESLAHRFGVWARHIWLEGAPSSLLHFVDFGHLSDIIVQNWKYFEDLIPSQHWLKQRFDELEKARNFIAHNRYLLDNEFERIDMYVADWNKQVGF